MFAPYAAECWLNRDITRAAFIDPGGDITAPEAPANAGSKSNPDGSFAWAACHQAQMNDKLPDHNGVSSKAVRSALITCGRNFMRPVYIVPAGHPTVPVFWYRQATRQVPNQEAGGLPAVWKSGQSFGEGDYDPSKWGGAMQLECAEVPVPVGPDGESCFMAPPPYGYGYAPQQDGTDGALSIWQPETGKMWTFWHFAILHDDPSMPQQTPIPEITSDNWRPPAGWRSQQNGYRYGYGNAGFYSPQKPDGGINQGDGIARPWPVAKPPQMYGSSGCDPIGMHILFEDLARGHINHMFSGCTGCAPQSGLIIPPAVERGDTKNNPMSYYWEGSEKSWRYGVPEAAVFRLDPSWSLPDEGEPMSKYPELAGASLCGDQLVTRMDRFVWKGMRDHGWFISDQGGWNIVFPGTKPLSTAYSHYSQEWYLGLLEDWGCQMVYYRGEPSWENPWGHPPNSPYATAPWGLVQQVVYEP